MTSTVDAVAISIQYADGTWENLNSLALIDAQITGFWGIPGDEPLDRIANTGEMNFTLKDPAGLWRGRIDDGSANSWGRGTRVDLIFTFRGLPYARFRGLIETIKFIPIMGLNPNLAVTVLDWMNVAARQPILSPTIKSDMTANTAIEQFILTMPVPPLKATLDTGEYTFPAIFDTVRQKSTALSEFSKLVFSEMGYLYVRKDRQFAETLIFENHLARHGMRDLSDVPAMDYLLDEDGTIILDEDGTSILDDSYTTFSVTDEAHDVEIIYGEPIINQATVRTYPRTLVATSVLYTLGSPISIGSAETKVITGYYTDPTGGGGRVNALDSTAAITSYAGNTASDGSGTVITADLTITTVFSANRFESTITNGNAKKGYVTVLIVSGEAVLVYNTVDTIDSDDASAEDFGWHDLTVNQSYQQDTLLAEQVSKQIVSTYKRPYKDIQSLSFHANRSDELMNAFLGLDIGHLIYYSDTPSGLMGSYYIQKIDFRVYSDNFIDFTWLLQRQRKIDDGYTAMALEGLGDVAGDGIDFGYLPQVSSLSERSFVFSVFLTDLDQSYTIGAIFSDEAGVAVSITNNGEVYCYQKGATGPGIWTTANGIITAGAWFKVVITRDSSDPANAPIMYVDGVSKTVTEDNPQVGATVAEDNCRMMLINVKTVTLDWPRNFDGIVKNFGIYNRILAASEILAPTEPTPFDLGVSSTDGLVFLAPAILDEQVATYTDATLTAVDKVLDAVYGAVGTPHGSPIIRAIS